MNYKNKTLKQANEELIKKTDHDILVLTAYLTDSPMPENSNIESTIQNLNNPEGLSRIYNTMLTYLDKDDHGKYIDNLGKNFNIGLIEEIDPPFSTKLKVMYQIVITNQQYIFDKFEEFIKYYDTNHFKPFKTDTENDINLINSSINDKDKGLGALKSKIENKEQGIENKIKSNIYTDFIAILGIFTAITFAIFGGMNLLSNLFQNIGSTQASLGQTLILAAIFGLFMWGITELLFYWISKIKGITDSTKDKNKILFNRSALIVIVSILSLGVLLFTYTIK